MCPLGSWQEDSRLPDTHVSVVSFQIRLSIRLFYFSRFYLLWSGSWCNATREAWSLKTWGIFVTAYSKEEDPILKQYRISLRAKAGEHVHELDPILKQISALSFNHITNLSIQRLKFTQSVFIIILKIPNLGVLALTQDRLGAGMGDSEDIDDNFVKKWSRLVVEEYRLLKLKVFIIRHFALTSCILNYFSALPALLLCNIESWILNPDPIGGINPRWGWDLLGR